MRKKKEITPRQNEILGFIKGFIKDFGVAPTRQEICDNYEAMRFPSAATYHIDALVKAGRIKIDPLKARGIVVRRERS